MLKFTLPGGAVVERPAATTAGEVLAAGPDAANTKKCVAAKVDGVVVDLSRKLSAAASVEPVMPGTPDGLEVLRRIKEVLRDLVDAGGAERKRLSDELETLRGELAELRGRVAGVEAKRRAESSKARKAKKSARSR